MDEIFDCVCGKSLGMKGMVYKPVCLVNMDGFYDGLLLQMERSSKEGEIKDGFGSLRKSEGSRREESSRANRSEDGCEVGLRSERGGREREEERDIGRES